MTLQKMNCIDPETGAIGQFDDPYSGADGFFMKKRRAEFFANLPKQFVSRSLGYSAPGHIFIDPYSGAATNPETGHLYRLAIHSEFLALPEPSKNSARPE